MNLENAFKTGHPPPPPLLPTNEVITADITDITDEDDDAGDDDEDDVLDITSPVHIITEDQNFSAAKFRWIQAVNKIRIKLRESSEGAAPVEKMRKSNWGAQAIASNFLSSIDSMPNFKPRRKSIPLVSEISAALMNRQKGGISSVLIGSRVSVQDNELKQHVYRKSLQVTVGKMII